MTQPGEPVEQGEEPRPGRPKRSGGGFWHALREIVIVVVAALVISAVVRTFLLQAFWVPSGSMEQTLVRGDRILVWKPGADPGHGDVIVFRDPADWLADPIAPEGLSGLVTQVGTFLGILPSSSGDDLVKRVVGTGGDTIECCSPDGRIMRNGQPLDEPYLYPGDPTDQVTFKVTVPEGRLFVMGDHRSDSADSRYHLEEQDGTVPVDNVVGVAKVIMWPVSRWATLPDYADADAQAAGEPR
jgi:signal peptidase I